jgi:hypothetical protein
MSSSDYYLSHKGQLLREFDKKQTRVRRVAVLHFGEDLTNTIQEEARQVYEGLLPDLPYIGGDANPWTDFINTTALSLGVYRALKAHGRTVEEAGRTLYQMSQALLEGYPRLLLRLLARQKFTSRYREALRKRAAASQDRRYPGDWVFTYVEGNGKDFDYGLDITECGTCKYLHAQGADELAPFCCLGDFPLSDAFGWGLVRTMTIAGGAPMCDFRLKRGRKVERVLPFASS